MIYFTQQQRRALKGIHMTICKLAFRLLVVPFLEETQPRKLLSTCLLKRPILLISPSSALSPLMPFSLWTSISYPVHLRHFPKCNAFPTAFLPAILKLSTNETDEANCMKITIRKKNIYRTRKQLTFDHNYNVIYNNYSPKWRWLVVVLTVLTRA